jgi:hypothetical protein
MVGETARVIACDHDGLRWWRIGLVVATPLVFGFWSLRLGRDANWDLQNYHWYNPYALLHWRYDRDVAPALGQSFFSPLLYVPWFLLGSTLPAQVVGFIIAAVQSLNLLLLHGLALAMLPIQGRLVREIVALVVATVGMCGGMSFGLLGTTFLDSVVTIGILGSLLAVISGRKTLIAASRSQAAWRAALSAIPAALAVAGKLAVAPFAIGLAAGFLVPEGYGDGHGGAPLRRRLWLLLWFGIGGTVTAAIVLGPWLIQVWSMTGAPFYPFYAHSFHSRFAGAAWNFDIWRPRDIVEALLYPFVIARRGYRVAEVPFTDLRFAAAYVLVPISLLLRMTRRKIERRPLAGGLVYLLAVMAIGYIVWLLEFSYYRYAVTLELLAPLALVLALLAAPLSWQLRAFIVAAVLLVLVATTRPADWGHLPWTKRLIEVSVPPISDPGTATVLLWRQPISYVVPSLPPAVAAIGLEMASWDGGDRAAWAQLIRERLASRSGAVYAIFFAGKEEEVREAAAPFNLSLDAALCQPMPTNLPSAGVPLVNVLSFCLLKRASSSAGPP